MLKYVTSKSQFCNEQFCFRPGHSTEIASSRSSCSGKGYNIIHQSAFSDMSKAFDTSNHEIILSKFAYYSVKGSGNNLLQNYVTERLQYFDFERQISDKLPITTGEPQGSILGQLLILIYINDLPSVYNLFTMIMYADDTTL